MEIDIQNSKVKSVEIDSNMFPLDSDSFSNIKCEISSETALIAKKEIPESLEFIVIKSKLPALWPQCRLF